MSTHCTHVSVPGQQEFSPGPQFKSIKSSALSFLYSLTLTSIQDYWKNHSFDYKHLCWQSDVSAFYTLSRFVIAFELVHCSMSGSNGCFLTCIQVSQETGKVVFPSV